MRTIAVFLAALLCAACNVSSGGGASVCTPGGTSLCNCVGGGVGVQVCDKEGAGFGDCDCEGAPKPVHEDTGDGPEDDASGDEPDLVSEPDGSEDCEPNNYKQCIGDDLYWFDSCNKKGALVVACTPPALRCKSNACVPGCVPNYEKGCDGNAVLWFDSCGKKGNVVEVCGGNTACANGACVSACTPHSYEACHEGNVTWFNSCAQAESVKEGCAADQFCQENAAAVFCAKPVYNGTWLVTASPDQASLGGIATVKFPPTNMELAVDGSAATGTIKTFNPWIVFTGTVEGKVLMMSTKYTETGGGLQTTHDSNLSATFKSPSEFTGIINETVTVEGLGPLGNIIWNIKGVRQ